MKAVILARVSSKEQEEGHSLDAQVSQLTEYATRKNLSVVKTFVMTESSTKGNRKKFQEAIKFIKDQKEPIALIVSAIDRLQRSFTDTPNLDKLRKEGKVEFHFYREGMVINQNSSSSEVIMWDFGVLAAKSYVESLRENVKRSLNFKLGQGEWVRNSPLGYINYKDEYGHSKIKIDPERAPIVKKMFQEYSKGGCSVRELTKKATEWGLRSKPARKNLTKTAIHNLIMNPFYYGQMKVKGKLYTHIYESLISKELWDKCQEVRTGYNAKPYKFCEKEFLYRGMITCANTGKIVSTDQKKQQYNYLICYDKDGNRQYIKEEIVTMQIERLLERIKIPDSLIEEMNKYLKITVQSEKEFHKSTIDSLRADLDKTNDRIKSLVDLYLDKKLDDETYELKYKELKGKKFETENLIAGHSQSDNKFNETIINLFVIANKLALAFKKSSKISQKREILKLVVRTLELDGSNLGFELNTPFNYMLNLAQCPDWRRV